MGKINKQQLTAAIGKRIARECAEKGISQKQLATKTGLTEAGVSRYINGQRLPRVDILILIAEALNCSVQYLLFGIE